MSIAFKLCCAFVPVQAQTKRVPSEVMLGPSIHVSLDVCLLPQLIPSALANRFKKLFPTPCQVRNARDPLEKSPGVDVVVSPNVTLPLKTLALADRMTLSRLDRKSVV